MVSLIHKYLNAGVLQNGFFEKTEEGVPQGGPLTPLCGNVMLNELDNELERRGHRFVRYADYTEVETMPKISNKSKNNQPYCQKLSA